MCHGADQAYGRIEDVLELHVAVTLLVSLPVAASVGNYMYIRVEHA